MEAGILLISAAGLGSVDAQEGAQGWLSLVAGSLWALPGSL